MEGGALRPVARWVVPVSGGGSLASDRNPSYLMMPLAQRRLRGLSERGFLKELDPSRMAFSKIP